MGKIKTASGKNFIRLETTDSTNAQAIKMLKSGNVSEGTVILADYQSAGKGQYGNIWVGEKGKNLTFSIVLYPVVLTARTQFFLSMCISNAIQDCLVKNNIGAKIKWPNDIYTSNGKIAGILIENALSGQNIKWSVAGIGLNVNQLTFGADAGMAVSMASEAGHEFNRDVVLNELLRSLSLWINRLYDNDLSNIKVRYLNNMLFLNEWRSFISETGLFEGRITDVTDFGRLMVQDRKGNINEFYFKDIKF